MFKKLKSIFIVDDGTPDPADKSKAAKPAAKDKATQPSGANTATPSAAAPKYDPQNPPKGKPQEKFVNRLLGALESNNLKGFDYLEYKQSVQNLNSVDMDEATRFKSALAMAKAMGATPDNLMSSAQHYVKVLAKEEAKFLEAFKNQKSLQVNNQNEEIKRLEVGIKQRKDQIAKLQKEIEAGEKALETKKSGINQANAKVQATKDGFYHAYHIVTEQILADIEKMKKYLS